MYILHSLLHKSVKLDKVIDKVSNISDRHYFANFGNLKINFIMLEKTSIVHIL